MRDNSQKQPDQIDRFQRAHNLQQGIGTDKLVRNTTLVPHWIIGTDCFWYRKRTESGCEFRLVDAKAAKNKRAFDHQALADGLASCIGQDVNPDNLPISNLVITLPLEKLYFDAFDQRYVFDVKTQHCLIARSVHDSMQRERVISPDGTKIIFLRENNLWVQNVDTGEERELTNDGDQLTPYGSAITVMEGGILYFGLQVMWSADSKRLLTVQADSRKINATPIIQHVPLDGSLRPVVTAKLAALPGDDVFETQRIVAIDVTKGYQQTPDCGAIPVNSSGYDLFVGRYAWWGQDNRHAYFIYQELGCQTVHVVEFDTETGATRRLIKELSDTYLSLRSCRLAPATILPLPETNELIWYSERTGWAHFYLYDLTSGELKNPITQGEWLVRELLQYDGDRRELWFQSAGRIANRDPYYLDICRVNIDSGEITPVISTDHEYIVQAVGTASSIFCGFYDADLKLNSAGVSPDSSYVVTTRSRVDQVPETMVLDRMGNTILSVETADLSGLPENWQWPEPVKLMAADGKSDIFGVIFRPSDFVPSKLYPVIDVSVCGATLAGVPKGSFTNSALAGAWYLQSAALAELGFIVVSIDGRGTVSREKAFVEKHYGWLPACNSIDDRISGIRQLAKTYPYMDITRVGIGFMGFNGSVGAVYGLLQRPDFYKVGVSATIWDSRLMWRGSSEDIEGLRSLESDYELAEKMVDNLQGKLLLMHGELDPKVPSANTWRLIDALQKANKDFDMQIFPSEGDLSMNDCARRYCWDYFVRYLQ